MKKFLIKKSISGPRDHFTIDYKAELNSRQYEAVTSTEGPFLVIAGAGSGKTRTLIYRLAWLVENGAPPQTILLLTFTRKSAQEMMRRAESMLDERCRNVAGGTFHSFANSILRKYSEAIGINSNFSIVDRGDAEDLINMIRTQLKLHKKERRFPRKTTLMSIISKAANKCLPTEEVILSDYPAYKKDIDDIAALEKLYREFKGEKMIMDYDDLLLCLLKLLETHPESRKLICGQYRYIMVDEYQDTNMLQARIAMQLASVHHNIMAVGDDSQSIYSFRGAHFRNIMDFPELFPGTRIITLEENYRSTSQILDLTNAIIERASEKYSKVLFTRNEGGEKPVFISGASERDQAALICQRTLELREEGVPLNKIAVLFRAAWHSNELEIALKKANIPYIKYGGLKFGEAAHVKDVLSYMRVLCNPFDGIAWIRLLEIIEGLGPSFAAKITEKIIDARGDLNQLLAPDWAKRKFALELRRLHTVLSRLHSANTSLKPTEHMEAIINYYTPRFEFLYDDYRRRREDLTSLLHLSERYSDLEHMLSDMALEPPNIYQEGVTASDLEDERLTLSTIHSAKGLEWHSVFLIHLVDGYFPDTRSEDDEDDMEEERRLFYVAATRAQRGLYLIAPQLESRGWNYYSPGGVIFTEPSRFLTEIPRFRDLVEPGVLEFEEDSGGRPF